MKFVPFILWAGILMAGCQSESPAQDTAPKTDSAAAGKAAEPSTEASGDIKPGMSMADVKKVKGAPLDTKHEHGPNGSELDFWVYEDQTVKFQDGKVSE